MKEIEVLRKKMERGMERYEVILYYDPEVKDFYIDESYQKFDAKDNIWIENKSNREPFNPNLVRESMENELRIWLEAFYAMMKDYIKEVKRQQKIMENMNKKQMLIDMTIEKVI